MKYIKLNITILTKKQIVNRLGIIFKAFTFLLLSIFLMNTVWFSPGYAQEQSLPRPGSLVALSDSFAPLLIQGIKVSPLDPFQFEFILRGGDTRLTESELEQEALKLIRYFLSALTTPDDEIWVNLSPYEENRIVPDQFGMTEMGQDMLAQDYLLKQIASSLLHPESEQGEDFWNRIYQEQAKVEDVSIETLSKVWIVPESAEIYSQGNIAMIMDSRLKILMEKEYESLREIDDKSKPENNESEGQEQIFQEVIIPIIEKEVNEGKSFAPLRQIYHSLILATWFKRNLQKSLLGKKYVGKRKITGIQTDEGEIKQDIYDLYVEGYRKGVFNFVREEYDPQSKQLIPRKYFSGGENFIGEAMDAAMSVKDFEDGLWQQIQKYRKGKKEKGDAYKVSASLVQQSVEDFQRQKMAEGEKGRLMLDLKHALLKGKKEKIAEMRERVKISLSQSEIDAMWVNLAPHLSHEMGLLYLDQFYVQGSSIGTFLFMSLARGIFDMDTKVKSDFLIDLLKAMGDFNFVNDYQTIVTFTYPVETVTRKELVDMGFDADQVSLKLVSLGLASKRAKGNLKLVERFDEKEEELKAEFPDEKERKKLIESLQITHSLNFLELAAANNRVDFMQLLLNNGYFDAPRFLQSAMRVAQVSQHQEVIDYLKVFLKFRREKTAAKNKGTFDAEEFLVRYKEVLNLSPFDSPAKPGRKVIRRRKKKAPQEKVEQASSDDASGNSGKDVQEDAALSVKPERVGGIDFNLKDFRIKSTGESVRFQIDAYQMQDLIRPDFSGFSPFILQVIPLNNSESMSSFFVGTF